MSFPRPYLTAVLLAALPCQAATIRVPADYPTIQAGLDAAAAGDEVLVAAGTWTQTTTRTFVFDGETLTLTAVAFAPAGVSLVSENGPAVTTIRIENVGTNGHAVVAALLGSTNPILVRGFRFERQLGGAPAVLLRENPDGTAVTVDDCIFAPMQGPLNEGAGIWSVQGGSLTVSSCLFDDVDNPASCGTLSCRGAIGYWDGHSVDHSLRVTDTEFRGCDGGGIRSTSLDFVAARCTFTDCTSASTASGIRAEAATVLVEDCAFDDCTDTPLRVRWGDATIRRCRFIGGSGDLAGAVLSLAAQTTVDDCVFEDCVGGYAGAVHLSPPVHSPSWIRRNLFRGIRTETFAAYYQSGGVIGTLQANTFVDCSSSGSISAACAFVHPSQHGITDVSRNIFTGSTGSRPAVRVFDDWAGTLLAGCNLYWDNEGGDADGFVPAETAIFADPLFCDPDNGDFTIQSNSPCAPPGVTGCGLVGALPVGCGPVSLESESWGHIKSLYR